MKKKLVSVLFLQSDADQTHRKRLQEKILKAQMRQRKSLMCRLIR